MNSRLIKYRLSFIAFAITAFILCMVQWKVSRPILMAERFAEGTGCIQVMLMAGYAAWITLKMQDPGQSAKWRRIAWTIFSVVFFGQLILGLTGFERFLMTGKLHLPIPVMILSGPIFRGSIGFMPILFLSTLLISGPAWCSQLCYFGALDNLASDRKADIRPLRHTFRIKHVLLFSVIAVTILLRAFGVQNLITTLLAAGFGVVGLAIILLVSVRKGKMVHCILWCPIGTLVNYMKLVSPFRMYIDDSCTDCLACTRYCKYDALNKPDIIKRKPGRTCTYCGDCLVSCKTSSIRYKFLSLSPGQARNAWIVLTISLHAIFLALGRI